MKLHQIMVFGCLACSSLLGLCQTNNAVPCLVFTGHSDNEQCLDLSKLNRITFRDDGMVVSSSNDFSVPEVQLPYSLYHHFEIGDAVPTASINISTIDVASGSRLLFCSDIKSLVVESTSDSPFRVKIYSLGGKLLAISEVHAGQMLSAKALDAGIYIAVASDGQITLTLKFIIN